MLMLNKFNYFKSNQSGITLVEVIVGMTIMLILMMPIAGIIKTSVNTYQYNMAQNHNISVGQTVLNTLSDELRYAHSPVISNSGMLVSYTVTIKVNSVDRAQSRRIYIGDGSSTDTPKNTLIVEYTDPLTNVKSYKQVGSGTIVSDSSNPLFVLDSASKTMTVSIQVNDNSYNGSPTAKFDTDVIILNM